MIDGKDLIRLDEICEQYFSINPVWARRKAARGILPIPAFRLSGTTKGPLYVRKSELEKWVADRVAKAEKLNSQMRLAGAV